MGWSLILKSLLLMSVKQRVQQVKTEEVYAKAIYLPILYVLINTPGTFFLLAIGLLASAGVVQFYPQYFFPTDFVLTLAGVALLGSGFSYLAFQRILKQVLWNETQTRSALPLLDDKVQQAIGPIKAQFAQEHAALKTAIRERKNKSRDHFHSHVGSTH